MTTDPLRILSNGPIEWVAIVIPPLRTFGIWTLHNFEPFHIGLLLVHKKLVDHSLAHDVKQVYGIQQLHEVLNSGPESL